MVLDTSEEDKSNLDMNVDMTFQDLSGDANGNRLKLLLLEPHCNQEVAEMFGALLERPAGHEVL